MESRTRLTASAGPAGTPVPAAHGLGRLAVSAPRLLLLFALALYLPATLHSALKHGYFVDGMIYASLARNLAEGYGSFWHMQFSDGLFASFREHPPLGIYIQSLFYRLFGDTELIDKFYGFFIGFGILGGIARIWHQVGGRERGAWFPLLTFILFPITGYVLSYNWLEHILTLNIVLTATLLIGALQAHTARTAALLSALAGGLIFTGILIKGPVALYPLALPFFWWLFLGRRDARRALLATAMMVTALVLAFGVLFAVSDEGYAFFRDYLQQQVVNSIQGKNSVHARTKLLESLLTEELVAPLVVFAIAMFVTRTGWRTLDSRGPFPFFLAMAIAGSLPLMVSQKQNDYYLFISMPFYALAIAALFEPLRRVLEQRTRERQRTVIGGALFFLLLGPLAMWAGHGQYRKDPEYHRSFTETGLQLERRSRVTACPPERFFRDWNLTANFQRYHAATLTREPGQRYLVTTPEAVDSCVHAPYRRVSTQDTPLQLYFRGDDAPTAPRE
jgi:hypothetical protein